MQMTYIEMECNSYSISCYLEYSSNYNIRYVRYSFLHDRFLTDNRCIEAKLI